MSLDALQWAKLVTSTLFVFAFGAICGSFINVIAYRLPLGRSIVSPPSACPRCGARLTWRENFPILGWILLRGKCRSCRAPISPEYPIVEAFVAILFAATFLVWFGDPHLLRQVGFDPTPLRPEWAGEGLVRVWPYALLIAALFFALTAITLIDAHTFHIPLSIPWILGAAAVLAHPLLAAWIASGHGFRRDPHPWVIPVPGWPWIIGSLAATLGLGISMLLLRRGLLPRSFADYDEWERAHRAATAPGAPAPPTLPHSTQGGALLRAFLFAGPIVAGMFLGLAVGMQVRRVSACVTLGAGLGAVVGLVLRRHAPGDDAGPVADPIFVAYPHARREMLKECLFLLCPRALGALALWLAPVRQSAPPLWLAALGGSLRGMRVGGGIVWATRIFAALAFGKEAMGLGDVHLMAAVGAVLGWIDPIAAFFIAPFFGLGWAASMGILRLLRRSGAGATALPYGPHLAAATVLVVLAKPGVEAILSAITRQSVDLP